MKIGIDANHITVPYHSGQKTYSLNLLYALARNDKKNEYVIFASKKSKIPKQPNFRLVVTPRLISFSKRQFLLSKYVSKEKIDVFHYLVPYGDVFLNHKNIVTTVHDVALNYTYPIFSKYFLNRVICEITRAAVFRRTRFFIVPTKTIKDELLKLATQKKLSKNIETIYEGVSIEFKRLPLQRRGVFFLCIADQIERKNFARILSAYGGLVSMNKIAPPLRIVASKATYIGKYKKLFAKLKIQDKVSVDINPSVKKMALLYNQAICLVWPSLYEGFGLPIIEAMACGCPVITSNYGAMKEVSGSASLLVNPRSPLQIQNAMHSILKNRDLALRCSREGLKRAKSFSWDVAARNTMRVYRQSLMLT